MQENKFEKKLQQKMEALQVQPTDEVWEKVKVQVAQKKSKRRFLFLFAAAGILLAGLFVADALNMFNNKQDLPIAKSKTATPTANEQQAISENTSDANTVAAMATQHETVNINNEEKNKSNLQAEPVTTVIKSTRGNHTSVSVGNNADGIKRYPIAKRRTKASTKATSINALPVEENEAENITAVISESSQNDKVANTVQGNTIADIKNDIPATTVTKVKAKEIKQPEMANNTGKEKQEKETKKQKWGMGVNFSGGVSYAGYNNTAKSNAYADFVGATPGSTPTANPNTYYPSVTKKSFGFCAGIEVYRYISDKVKIASGIQYQLFSTSQKTGTRGGLQAYSNTRFAYGTTNTYVNKYHYLTLPVGITAAIFTIANKEVLAGADINFSRLFKTNALTFDTANGNYYQNQSAFNRTFIGLSASLSVNLAAKNKPAFYIGPQFYYSLTPLANSGMYVSTHSSFIGLRLQKNLTK